MTTLDLRLVVPAAALERGADPLSMRFRLVDEGTVAISDPAGDPLGVILAGHLPGFDPAVLQDASMEIEGETAKLTLDDRSPRSSCR